MEIKPRTIEPNPWIQPNPVQRDQRLPTGNEGNQRSQTDSASGYSDSRAHNPREQVQVESRFELLMRGKQTSTATNESKIQEPQKEPSTERFSDEIRRQQAIHDVEAQVVQGDETRVGKNQQICWDNTFRYQEASQAPEAQGRDNWERHSRNSPVAAMDAAGAPQTYSLSQLLVANRTPLFA